MYWIKTLKKVYKSQGVFNYNFYKLSKSIPVLKKLIIFVKPGKKLIFLKNDKNSKNFQNGSGKPEIFSKSQMTKQTSPLDSFR